MQRNLRSSPTGRGGSGGGDGALARALGVTRIARVTGLDRSGLEVACAVRPGGHVLQVTNGKGATARQAARGALREAAELACAERVDEADLLFSALAALRARGVPHLDPAALGGDARPGDRLAWRRGRDLATGRPVLVPAAAVHAPPPGGPSLGLARLRWTSNGMGAHPSWPAALLHALLEAVERDQLARALPGGWTGAAVAARRVPPAALRAVAPRAAALAAAFARRGLEPHLFDLAPARARGGLGLPVAGALLFGAAHGPLPLTAGYACRLDPDAALSAALAEAAQSRLTDVHGAREDVAPADRAGAERLRLACARAAARPAPPAPPRRARRPAPDPARAVREVVARLGRAGIAPVVAVDLAPPGLGLRVAKVLAPGLLLSGLL